MELDDFVFGAFVRLSFNISDLPTGTGIVGKLQRNGSTTALINTTVGSTLTMSSATNTLEAGRYRFVLTWQTTDTQEPIEEHETDLIIRARK